jgi:hypothetical protein
MLREAAARAREAVLTEAQKHGSEPRDFASTLLVVVVGPYGGGALQIGDGVIVVSDSADGWCWVFWPQRGEYANTRHFLTDEDAAERLQVEPFSGKMTDVALMTDGLEPLALHYASRSFIRVGWIAHGRRRVAHPGDLPAARSSGMMQLTLTLARTTIHFGQELGWGGEGAVFAVEGQKDRVAKIYSAPPDHRKVQKLLVMAAVASPSLLKIAAWPVDLLSDSKGAVCGFIMPRVIARRDIHELYSPKSRSETFPEADFRFLVHVGANIARAFAAVHEQGYVVGDVNHGNLLVGPDATVMFIDCDSFQIGNGAHVFTCDVGVPLFSAPELHGRTFRGLVRTANHDRLGLVVLLISSPLHGAASLCRTLYWRGRHTDRESNRPLPLRLRTRSRREWYGASTRHDPFGDDGRPYRAASHPGPRARRQQRHAAGCEDLD